jgi:hypothetical protein
MGNRSPQFRAECVSAFSGRNEDEAHDQTFHTLCKYTLASGTQGGRRTSYKVPSQRDREREKEENLKSL